MATAREYTIFRMEIPLFYKQQSPLIFLMQIIEFPNATMENMGAICSIDITTAIFLVLVAFSFFVSFLAFYFTHLRGMSISLFPEYELPELQADDFKGDVPTSLLMKVNLLVLNSGNRAGVVKDLELEFNAQPDLKEFHRDKEVKWYSLRSAKTNQPASPILIKDQDTALVIFNGQINLDKGFSMRHHLRTLDIESNNLKTLLEEMLEYKKERLKKFINFLTENEKLGEFIISYSYTKIKFIFLPFIKFKNKDKHLKVRHSYKKTIKYYEDSLNNYQLSPHPKEIIKGIFKSIKALEEEFDTCSEEIKKHLWEDIFSLPFSSEWINRILSKEEEDFELLSKCRNYRKTIEENIKPLLKNLLIFNQKAGEVNAAPTEKLRQSLKEEIMREKEELSKKLKGISPKLEELKKEVEHELS